MRSGMAVTPRLAVVGVAIMWVLAFGLPAAARDDPPKTGTIVGRLESRQDTKDGKNTVIEVLTPGEERPRRYHVLYDPKAKAPLADVLKAVRDAKVGDKVEFDWVGTGHGPAIKKFQVLKKAPADKK